MFFLLWSGQSWGKRCFEREEAVLFCCARIGLGKQGTLKEGERPPHPSEPTPNLNATFSTSLSKRGYQQYPQRPVISILWKGNHNLFPTFLIRCFRNDETAIP